MGGFRKHFYSPKRDPQEKSDTVSSGWCDGSCHFATSRTEMERMWTSLSSKVNLNSEFRHQIGISMTCSWNYPSCSTTDLGLFKVSLSLLLSHYIIMFTIFGHTQKAQSNSQILCPQIHIKILLLLSMAGEDQYKLIFLTNTYDLYLGSLASIFLLAYSWEPSVFVWFLFAGLRHWGWNPGPWTCQGSALSLSYPTAVTLCSNYLHGTLHTSALSTCAFSLPTVLNGRS